MGNRPVGVSTVELTQELVDCRWQEMMRPLQRARARRRMWHGAAVGAACAAAMIGAASGLGVVVQETMESLHAL